METNRSFTLILCLGAAFLATPAKSHGYLLSPRSRNWVANQDGIEGTQQLGLPQKEYCPSCANSNTLVCGSTSTSSNYDLRVDSTGVPMPWSSQSSYFEGDTIRIKAAFTAFHYGHIELKACNEGRDSTQECLDSSPLTFIRDVLYDLPADPAYPDRGYLAPGKNQYEMEYKLPNGLVGSNVLIQVC
jgi:hypothetical protein